MDSDMLVNFTVADEEEEEALEEEYENTLTVAAAIVAGAEFARQSHIKTRNQSRLYLSRSQLLPDPRGDTPWKRLYDSQNDRAFITTMGFDVDTFGYILTSGFAAHWYTGVIPCSDTNTVGDPRPGRRSLDAAGALGLVLHSTPQCERLACKKSSQLFPLPPLDTSAMDSIYYLNVEPSHRAHYE